MKLTVSGGNFRTAARSAHDTLARVARDAVQAATDGAKAEMRQQIAAASLGDRLPNAMGSRVYPSGPSLGAAGFIYPRGKKAEKIFDAFVNAPTIKSANGFWLAIPTPDAYIGGPRGHRPTPAQFEQRTGIKLRQIRWRGNPRNYQLLVGDAISGRKRGVFRAPTKGRIRQGRAVQSVVFFILIPEAHMKKRLSFDAIAKRWCDRIPALIESGLPKDF